MSEQLFIRLQPETGNRPGEDILLEWVLRNEAGGIREEGSGSAEALSTWLTARVEGNSAKNSAKNSAINSAAMDVLFLAPADCCHVTAVSVPAKNKKKISKAIPYLVEDELVTDVEDCHFASGELTDSGLVRVAALSRKQMGLWVALFNDLGVHLDSIRIDALQLPYKGRPVMLIEPGRILLRLSDEKAMAGEPDFIFDLAGLSDEIRNEGLSVVLTVDAASQETPVRERLATLVNEEQLHFEMEKRRALAILSDHTPPGRQANDLELMQGEFKPRVKKIHDNRANWRAVAMFAAFAFLLQLMVMATQGWFLSSQAQQYASDSLALYQSVFPKDTDVRDIRRKWRAHLGGSGREEGFISLFSVAGAALVQKGLQLESVNYNENRGDLILTLLAKNNEDFVALSQDLQLKGLVVRIGAIDQSSSGVRGTLRIEAGI